MRGPGVAVIPEDEIFRARLDPGGFKDLCVLILSLEDAMDYPLVDGIKCGHRLWDSVVSGGGDIMLPRLVRVGDSEEGRRSRRAYITDARLRDGLYSGRICVELTDRAWRLVPTDAMAVGPAGTACDISLRLYGLVFVCPLPARTTDTSAAPAPLASLRFPTRAHLIKTIAEANKRAWDAVIEWMQTAEERPGTRYCPVAV